MAPSRAVALLAAIAVCCPRTESQAVIGRAGYSIQFDATMASQWSPGGPMIQVSKGTCVDGNGNCQCCSSQETDCCGQESSLFKLTGAFTVEAWVKYNGLGDARVPAHVAGNLAYTKGTSSCTAVAPSLGGSCASPTALGHCSAKCGGLRAGGFALYCGDDGGLGYCGLAVADASTASSILQLSTSSGDVSLGHWTHVAGSYFEARLQVFVDGSLRASHSFGSFAGAVPAAIVAAFSIGGRSDPTEFPAEGESGGDFGYSFFSGAIDEVRVWNDARNTAQVLADMLDTPCEGSRDQFGACNQLPPLLVAYWPFTSGPTLNGSPNSFVTNVAQPALPTALLAGSPAPTWAATELVNSSSYMDRVATGAVDVGQGVVPSTAGGVLTLTFRVGVTGSFTFVTTDPNPTDRMTIADFPIFPVAGGIPSEALFDASTYTGCCPSDPCSLNGPTGTCTPPYCGGDASCPAASLIGAQVRRTLTWTPSVNSDWIIPAGGMPLTFQFEETPTNPYDLALSAPAVVHAYPTIFLQAQVSPEFVEPTPDPTGAYAFNFTAYIGDTVAFTIKAQQRNEEQRVDLVVAEDPGVPNFAEISAPLEAGPALPIEPFTSSRDFAWRPLCHQYGLSRTRLLAVNRQLPHLRATKDFQFLVPAPAPALEGVDLSPRILSVGCELLFFAPAADQSNATRQQNNSNYMHEFSYSLSRHVRPFGAAPYTESLPIQSVLGLSVLSPLLNEYNGTTGRLYWRPVRGYEGYDYQLCVSVQDRCRVAAPVTACVDISIPKCQACLIPGDTMQAIAEEYKTDYLSLFSLNVALSSPDSLVPGTSLYLGLQYKARVGDSLASIGQRLFASVEHMLEVNPDIAERNNLKTQYSAPFAAGPGRVQVGPGANPLEGTGFSVAIEEGEGVCVLVPLCRLQCSDPLAECRLAQDGDPFLLA